MSEIKVNSIKGVGASAAAITVNNTDGTCTANITNNLSNRNLIINGAMQVAQRGTSVTATDGGYTTVDRFQQSVSNLANKVDIAQASLSSSDTGPYEAGFRKSYKVTNGDNTADADDQSKINYKIESQDLACSGWDSVNSNSKVTLSFWVKSSVAQTFIVHMSADDSNKAYAFEYAATTSWTKITHTISGASGLTFNNDNGTGIRMDWFIYMGTDKTDNSFTYNAWSAYSGSSRSRDMTTTWQTTNDATFEITGVQLEVGSVATDFEHRTYGQELALCERYCEATKPKTLLVTRFYGSSGAPFNYFMFRTQKRATPTISTSGTTFDTSTGFGAPTFASINENGSRVYINVTRTANGAMYIDYQSGNPIIIDAEL